MSLDSLLCHDLLVYLFWIIRKLRHRYFLFFYFFIFFSFFLMYQSMSIHSFFVLFCLGL